MTMRREQFEALAALFTYPDHDYFYAVENATASASHSAPAVVEFEREFSRTPLSNVQELYTSTFDLQPACSLDLGWHLFGEEYERGALLARMRSLLRVYGIEERNELPDHLSHALLLLAHMERAEAEDFAGAIVAPALERMLKAIPADNLFTPLLHAAQQLIKLYFPAAFEPASPQAEGVTS